MSPTIFRHKQYRFFFFSREESRVHVHVSSPDGEAKFWLEPVVALVDYYGLSQAQLKEAQKIIEGHRDDIKKSWQKHFKS
jgi:hypothetical protein